VENQDSLIAKNSEPPLCPVGESRCAVIDLTTELRLELSHLSEQVRTDPLTGLYNFRHFRVCLEQEMERSRRSEQPTALIMVDLDYFKKVNDQWGHEVGNVALIATAEALKEATRGLDILCRYGGEEFALILPATELLLALQVAERIRRAIQNRRVMAQQQRIELTASLGVDIYTHRQADSPEQFVARADQQLYRAKQSGRNRVCYGKVEDLKSAFAVSAEERALLSGFFGEDKD
jgi:diguanylate cyclase (GGDEF)-like protein